MEKNLTIPTFTSAFVDPYYMSNFKSLKTTLKNTGQNFESIEGFSTMKIRYEKKLYKFSSEYTHPVLFHISAKIKKSVKEKIECPENLRLLYNLTYEQRKLYRPKSSISGYQYDLKNAYTTVLLILGLIDFEIYGYLLQLKKQGININKILGMALLGESLATTYLKGQSSSSEARINKYSNVFKFVAYVLNQAFSYINRGFFRLNICKYVDSVLFTDKADIAALRECFYDGFLHSLKLANKRLSYESKSLGDIFDCNCFEWESAKPFIQFHEYYVTSIHYDTENGTLQFFRNNDIVTYHFSNLIGNKKYSIAR